MIEYQVSKCKYFKESKMEIKNNAIEAKEEIFFMNILEENDMTADMLCNSLGCG